MIPSNLPDDHPLQVALRTYSLALCLALGPVLLPAALASAVRPKSFHAHVGAFRRALLRELRPTGFASAITVAVAGGAALQRLWNLLGVRAPKLSPCQRTFLANAVSSTFAVTLLRWTRRRRGATSPTLDLTLLFLVRALDAFVQALLFRRARDAIAQQVRAPMPRDDATSRPPSKLLDKQSEDLAKALQSKVVTHLDALVFWASSARIMWCFFYQPQRLSHSFLNWISSLANVDKRLLEALRGVREGTWSYVHPSSAKRDVACSLAEELGRSPSWGDPTILPAYGGTFANKVWKQLGVDGRSGIGGMPCELVHGGIGAGFGLQDNCVANAAIRAVYAFAQALLLHLPAHFLPILFASPSSIMRPNRAVPPLLSAIRGATFLSTFVSSCWFGVCFTRTLVPAWLFPNVSHDVWDGPYGGTLVGSLVCGMSIWIENARRRREVALYVLPKALRASIPEKWLHSGQAVARFAECLTFILSLASLLTFSTHRPDSLRGLSKRTLTFVLKGPNTGLWKGGRNFRTANGPLVNSPNHED